MKPMDDAKTEEAVEILRAAFARDAYPKMLAESDLGAILSKCWKEESLLPEEFSKLESHIRGLNLISAAPASLHKWRGREAQRRLGEIPTPPVMWVITYHPEMVTVAGDTWTRSYMAGPYLTFQEGEEHEQRYVGDMRLRPVRKPGEMTLEMIIDEDSQSVANKRLHRSDEPRTLSAAEEELIVKLLGEGKSLTRTEAKNFDIHLHLKAALWHDWHAKCHFNYSYYEPFREAWKEIEKARGENPDREPEVGSFDPLYVVQLGTEEDGDLIGFFDTRDEADAYKKSIGAPDLKVYAVQMH